MSKTIFVIDDEKDIQNILEVNLRNNGYKVNSFSSAEKALESLKKTIPDLIILDLMLPKMDGCKVCRLLKFDEKYRHIPIVMLTARAQSSDNETGMAVGADEPAHHLVGQRRGRGELPPLPGRPHGDPPRRHRRGGGDVAGAEPHPARDADPGGRGRPRDARGLGRAHPVCLPRRLRLRRGARGHGSWAAWARSPARRSARS